VETLSGKGESFRVGVRRRRRKLNKGKSRGRIHSGKKNEKKKGDPERLAMIMRVINLMHDLVSLSGPPFLFVPMMGKQTDIHTDRIADSR
jgi:hypothetical protein